MIVFVSKKRRLFNKILEKTLKHPTGIVTNRLNSA
jgi:hypothetical protein